MHMHQKNMPATPPKATDENQPKSFTSDKLDVLDCISMDPRVTPAEFRVAFRLMQHANGENGAIFPAQDRIADQTGMKLRTVRACIAGLVDKGWLNVIRPNKRLPNLYRFKIDHMNAILDRQTTMGEYRKEERAAKKRRFDRHSDAAHNVLTGSRMTLVSGSQMTPNTLSVTPEQDSSTEIESTSTVGEGD